MGTAERRIRERTERERRITAAARSIAEAEGWSAVTIRRLAEEIEYSQPVVYSHFDSREAIVAAVAVEGFRDLTATLRRAKGRSVEGKGALEKVASGYLAFASAHAATYEAMFSLSTGLHFGTAEAKDELRAAFEVLASVAHRPGADSDIATETLWATLHGLADLERSGRIRPSARRQRIALIAETLTA